MRTCIFKISEVSVVISTEIYKTILMTATIIIATIFFRFFLQEEFSN